MSDMATKHECPTMTLAERQQHTLELAVNYVVATNSVQPSTLMSVRAKRDLLVDSIELLRALPEGVKLKHYKRLLGQGDRDVGRMFHRYWSRKWSAIKVFFEAENKTTDPIAESVFVLLRNRRAYITEAAEANSKRLEEIGRQTGESRALCCGEVLERQSESGCYRNEIKFINALLNNGNPLF